MGTIIGSVSRRKRIDLSLYLNAPGYAPGSGSKAFLMYQKQSFTQAVLFFRILSEIATAISLSQSAGR